jgi:hypothetical protein
VHAPFDLASRARRSGPLRYSALRPGAPAVIPATAGAWLAESIERWWQEMGRPDPYTVVELGAGDGTRAATVLAADLACARALRYILVEEDPIQRAAQGEIVALEEPAELLGPVDATGTDPDGFDDIGPETGRGPLAASLATPPSIRGDVVVVAMGWLSSLPADRFVRREGRWCEVRLAAPETSADPARPTVDLIPVVVPAAPDDIADIARLAGGPDRPGALDLMLQRGASAWLLETLGSLVSGTVVVVDAPAGEWSRPEPAGAATLSFGQLARTRPDGVAFSDERLFPMSGARWDVRSGRHTRPGELP